jgi:hypothetical protein
MIAHLQPLAYALGFADGRAGALAASRVPVRLAALGLSPAQYRAALTGPIEGLQVNARTVGGPARFLKLERVRGGEGLAPSADGAVDAERAWGVLLAYAHGFLSGVESVEVLP